MRRIAPILLPLLAWLPLPVGAQELSYDLDFDAAVSAPAAEPAGARIDLAAAPQDRKPGAGYVVDDTHAALVGVTDGTSLATFDAMLRDHPGIATIEMIDCPGTEDDYANLRLGRMIRARGIATHVPDDGFVGSGAVELCLAGVHRSAEPGAEFAVHSWKDESGREPGDYADDAPHSRAYLDYYRAMGMSEAQARAFYTMTNSVRFTDGMWPTAGEMDRWTHFDDAVFAPASAAPQLAVASPPAAKPRALAYGPFRIVDDAHAALVGATDALTPAAFTAMLQDHPGIATLEMIDCPGTEDDGANLRLGQLIRAKGIATHVPDNGWVASGAVELFLAGKQRSAEATARFVVHSWEDSSGRGPNDYAPGAPKNRAYLDYYRAMGMSDREARAFYAMTNATPFERPRSLTTDDMAQWTHLEVRSAIPVEPRGTFTRAATGQVLAVAF